MALSNYLLKPMLSGGDVLYDIFALKKIASLNLEKLFFSEIIPSQYPFFILYSPRSREGKAKAYYTPKSERIFHSLFIREETNSGYVTGSAKTAFHSPRPREEKHAHNASCYTAAYCFHSPRPTRGETLHPQHFV